jgi:hypothetical protein
VRWDLVPRGPLPAGCSTVGVTALDVNTSGAAYASGPSLTCGPGPRYWVRAVVKVAAYDSDGQWSYLTPVNPSAPTLDRTPSHRSELTACSSGQLLEPVASFVLLWPDGHQVRYKLVGPSARCR